MQPPLRMNRAPLNRDEIDMLEIELAQTPTDSLKAEYLALRDRVRGKLTGVRVPGSAMHPDLATLQLLERELMRRHEHWPETEAKRVINRSDVPLDGPRKIPLAERKLAPTESTPYTELAAMTVEDARQFVSDVKRKTGAELEEMASHLSRMVQNTAGWVRQTTGIHPDLERLQLVEIEIFDREQIGWQLGAAWRGLGFGALVGALAGYLAGRTVTDSAAIGAGLGGILAYYSADFGNSLDHRVSPRERNMTSDTSALIGLGAGVLALYLITRKVQADRLEAQATMFADASLEGYRNRPRVRRPLGAYRTRAAALR